MKIRKLVSVCMAVIITITTITTPALAAVPQGGTLKYWYQNTSDPYEIGKWGKTSLTYAIKNLHAVEEYPIVSSCKSASEAWGKALGLSIKSTMLTSKADIPVFVGTYNELAAIGIGDNSNTWAGVTIPDRSYDGYYYYGGNYVSSFTITHAEIGMLDDHMRGSEEVRKRVLHEFGHAMGWFGHAKSNAYIMWTSSSAATASNLTSGDINHLSQIYK